MQLKMYRPAGLPPEDRPVPPGFTLREMVPGEEVLWGHVCEGEFSITEPDGAFAKFMGWDEGMPIRDVFFVCRDGMPVGTAGARLYKGEPYLHYIAVRPEARGCGLSYVLVAAVLARHAAYGRSGCYLTTDDFRLPAIKCYLNMGYRPVLWSDDARERWQKLLTILSYPPVEAFADDGTPLSPVEPL